MFHKVFIKRLNGVGFYVCPGNLVLTRIQEYLQSTCLGHEYMQIDLPKKSKERVVKWCRL